MKNVRQLQNPSKVSNNKYEVSNLRYNTATSLRFNSKSFDDDIDDDEDAAQACFKCKTETTVGPYKNSIYKMKAVPYVQSIPISYNWVSTQHNIMVLTFFPSMLI